MKRTIYENGYLYTRGWVLYKVFDTNKFESDRIYRTNLYNVDFKSGIDLIRYTTLGKKPKKKLIPFRIIKKN